MKLVNAETLAAALRVLHPGPRPWPGMLSSAAMAALLMETVPPDPRLAALLAAVAGIQDAVGAVDFAIDRVSQHPTYLTDAQKFLDEMSDALRDALAAFEEGT